MILILKPVLKTYFFPPATNKYFPRLVATHCSWLIKPSCIKKAGVSIQLMCFLTEIPSLPPPSIYAACLLIIVRKIRGEGHVKTTSGMTDRSECSAIWHLFPLFKRTTGTIPHNPPSSSQHHLPFELLW